MTISSGRKSIALRAIAVAVATTSLVASSTIVMASPRDDHQNAQWGQDYGASQHDFHRGDHMGQNDWNSSQRVDYRSHHLNRPPNGYEWREHNGQYVLAAIATGVIMSVILDSAHH